MQRRSLVIHTLLAIARQRAGLDEPRCRLVLELIEAAEQVRVALRNQLGISEGRFAALVALFANDPSPITSADLAGHAGISRSAITEVLDKLEADRLIARHRDTTDRRIIYVNITDEGRAAIDATVTRMLAACGQVASQVNNTAIEPLLSALTQLHEGASLSTPSLSSSHSPA